MSTKTKRTRLLARHRNQLSTEAIKRLQLTEQQACAEAYEVARSIVRKAVEKKYPVRDMNVLKKYDLGQFGTRIDCSLADGTYTQFEFVGDKHAPWVPSWRCGNRAFAFDEADSAIISQWHEAREAMRKAEKEAEQQINAVIRNATTYEQIEDALPWAKDLREAVIGEAKAVSIVSPETLAAVQAMDFREPKAA